MRHPRLGRAETRVVGHSALSTRPSWSTPIGHRRILRRFFHTTVWRPRARSCPCPSSRASGGALCRLLRHRARLKIWAWGARWATGGCGAQVADARGPRPPIPTARPRLHQSAARRCTRAQSFKAMATSSEGPPSPEGQAAAQAEGVPASAATEKEAEEVPKQPLSEEECVSMLENGKVLLNEDRYVVTVLA